VGNHLTGPGLTKGVNLRSCPRLKNWKALADSSSPYQSVKFCVIIYKVRAQHNPVSTLLSGADLWRLRTEAQAGGMLEQIAQQRAKGRLTAWEREITLKRLDGAGVHAIIKGTALCSAKC